MRLRLWLGLALAIACATLIGAAGGWAFSQVGQPFPGVFVTNRLIAGHEVSSEAARLGLKVNDVIVSVGEQAISTRAELQRAVADGLASGLPTLPVTVQRDAVRATAEIALSRMASSDLLELQVEGLIIASLFLVLVAVCFAARWADPAAAALLLFGSGTAAYLAGRVFSLVGPFPGPGLGIILAILGSAALHVALVFPRPMKRLGRPLFVVAAYAPAVALSAMCVARGQPYGVVRNGEDMAAGMLAEALVSYWTLIGALCAFTILGWRAVRDADEQVRDQARIALFGAAVAFLPALVFSILPTMAHYEIPAFKMAPQVFLPIFPAALVYAVMRRDLFGLDHVARRTATFAIVTGVLGLSYFVLTLSLQTIMGARDWSEGTHLLVTAFLVVAFGPVRDWTRSLVDRVFLRVPYDFRQVVTDFDRASRTSAEVSDLVAAFRETVEGALHPEWLEVRIPAEAISRDASVFLALSDGSEDLGSVALGPKRSGQAYFPEDRDLLEHLGRNVAMGIRQVDLIHQVADRARLKREVEIAAEVQAGLMGGRQSVSIPAFVCISHYRPALEVADAGYRMAYGQDLDFTHLGETPPAAEQYLAALAGKTGGSFRLMTRMGALAAGASDEVVDAMGDFGLALGVAMQITGDMRELVVVLAPSDLRNGLWTLPTLLAHSLGVIARVGDLVGIGPDERRLFFEEKGVMRAVAERQGLYMGAARDALARTGLPPEKLDTLFLRTRYPLVV